MVLERIQIFAYRLECEIFRIFGYFVIFLAKNIVEISFRIVESKYCEAHRVSDRDWFTKFRVSNFPVRFDGSLLLKGGHDRIIGERTNEII